MRSLPREDEQWEPVTVRRLVWARYAGLAIRSSGTSLVHPVSGRPQIRSIHWFRLGKIGMLGKLPEIRGSCYCRNLGREILLQRRGSRRWLGVTAACDTDRCRCLPHRWPPPECSFASSGLCHCETSAASAFFPGARVCPRGLNAAFQPAARKFCAAAMHRSASADDRQLAGCIERSMYRSA